MRTELILGALLNENVSRARTERVTPASAYSTHGPTLQQTFDPFSPAMSQRRRISGFRWTAAAMDELLYGDAYVTLRPTKV
jgi:hypothetical protein